MKSNDSLWGLERFNGSNLGKVDIDHGSKLYWPVCIPVYCKSSHCKITKEDINKVCLFYSNVWYMFSFWGNTFFSKKVLYF